MQAFTVRQSVDLTVAIVLIKGNVSNVMPLVFPQLLLIQYQVSYVLSQAIVLMTQKLKQMTTNAWQEAAPANINVDSLGLIAVLSNTMMSVSEVKSAPLCHTALSAQCTECSENTHAQVSFRAVLISMQKII